MKQRKGTSKKPREGVKNQRKKPIVYDDAYCDVRCPYFGRVDDDIDVYCEKHKVMIDYYDGLLAVCGGRASEEYIKEKQKEV